MQSLLIKVADLTLDTVTREVSVGKNQPRLTATELSILEVFILRSPATVSRRSIALAGGGIATRLRAGPTNAPLGEASHI